MALGLLDAKKFKKMDMNQYRFKPKVHNNRLYIKITTYEIMSYSV